MLSATFEKFAPEGYSVTQAPYPIISYKQAMLEFGTDKPDLRNPLRIIDVTEFFQRCTFKPFHREEPSEPSKYIPADVQGLP